MCIRDRPKETWAVPGRAGDVARNGGEARVSRVAPDVSTGHDSDRVSVTLVFAHENGAGLEPPVRSRLVAPGEAVQELVGIRINPTVGLLLDMPADKPGHEVLGESRRWGRPQCRAPQGAKLIEAERPYAVDLGLDRLVIG